VNQLALHFPLVSTMAASSAMARSAWRNDAAPQPGGLFIAPAGAADELQHGSLVFGLEQAARAGSCLVCRIVAGVIMHASMMNRESVVDAQASAGDQCGAGEDLLPCCRRNPLPSVLGWWASPSSLWSSSGVGSCIRGALRWCQVRPAVVLLELPRRVWRRLIDVCSGFIHGEDDYFCFHALFPSLPDAGLCGLPAPVHGFSNSWTFCGCGTLSRWSGPAFPVFSMAYDFLEPFFVAILQVSCPL